MLNEKTVETIALLSKKQVNGKVKNCEKEEKEMQKFEYREEEIPDCGCIYG